MALRVGDLVAESMAELRYEPTAKRIRATADGVTIADSDRAMLVWEPRRAVPYYALPAEDLRAEIVAETDPQPRQPPGRVLHAGPGSFAQHTAHGEEASLRFDGGVRERAAFRYADPELAGYIGLDFDAFDAWLEEEEPIVAHARDPFHRVDIRRGSRHVRIEVGGQPLADSHAPRLLFETHLPVRFYLPREDVRFDLLSASPTRTACAYKGLASYWTFHSGGGSIDVAWSYLHPLPEATEIAGMVAFFDERVDVDVDGRRRARPRTPWSQ